MTVSVNSGYVQTAFADKNIDKTEASQLINDTEAEVGKSLADPSKLQAALKKHLVVGGLDEKSANAAATAIVDTFGFGNGTTDTKLPFEGPLQVSFKTDLVTTPGGAIGTGFSGMKIAKDPTTRASVYAQMAARMNARLGGNNDWAAMGRDACGLVKNEMQTLNKVAASLQKLSDGVRQGNEVIIYEALKELGGQAMDDTSSMGRALGIFMKSKDMTVASLLKGNVADTIDIFRGKLETMGSKFREANKLIFENIAVAYDQFDRGGSAAVDNPKLKPAFKNLEAAEKCADPVQKKALIREATQMIADFEQHLIQPQFDAIKDTMDGIPEITWKSPKTGKTEVICTGAEWQPVNSRVNIIMEKIASAYGI
jgi:hypothetical protein